MKTQYMNTHYPGLDIRPVRNYLGGNGNGTYDVVWYYCGFGTIAVLEDDSELKIKVTQGLLKIFSDLNKCFVLNVWWLLEIIDERCGPS